jgi:hypothetical protein
MAASVKPLFQAIRSKPKGKGAALPFGDLPVQNAPREGRDPLDYDPTPPDATAAFLAVEAAHMARHGNLVWENAVGGGHMARVITRAGFEVIGSDLVDRGWPGLQLCSFYDYSRAPAPIIVSNPPYCEITSRASGRWMWHSLGLGVPYIAYLLSADWPAARINSMDRLFAEHPPSIDWKIDFRGQGQAPQRNSFFVWDANRPAPGPDCWPRMRLKRDAADPAQGVLL